MRHPRIKFPRILSIIVTTLMLVTVPATAAFAETGGFVGSAVRPQADGYWLVTASGAVSASGAARNFGDMHRTALNRPIVGMASTASGNGYWLLAGDGGIFSFGDASFFGSTGAIHLNQPIVGMSATPSGQGYWLVARDGGIFSFGDASFFGSTGNIRLNKPVVGMSSTSSGRGYWLVATDGGIFAFGDAGFFGSTGNISLNQPIVGISASPSAHGYYMAAADGGIFAFGDARFYGSGVSAQSSRAIGIVPVSTGGYNIVHADGTVDHKDATTPIPEAASGGVSNPAGWPLKAQDDFTSLNSGHWGIYDGGTDPDGGGLRTRSNVFVSNGEMTVNSHDSTVGGTCWCFNNSGQTYGRWEVRARMDVGGNANPAILLWPDSENWPVDGEIDIAEMNRQRTQTQFTLHWGASNSQVQHSESGDFSQWHTYGVEWEPDHISYYLDGLLKYTNRTSAAIPHTPMHLGLQVDGSGAGSQQVGLHVDWIKIYQP